MAGTGFVEYPGVRVCFSLKVTESSNACLFDNVQEAQNSTMRPHYNPVNISRGTQRK